MSTTDKKSAVKKTAKKTVTKKTAAKKTVNKKTGAKKTAVKKTAVSKPDFDPGELSRIGAKNLHALAMDIDRQMKMFAEMDTRVLIAKDQLADFQEMIQAKISAFQSKSASNQTESHTDIMKSIRETKDEAAKFIKESKAIHETYELLVNQLEKGRVAAIRETKKAETVFMKKFNEVETKLLEKAKEIKRNIKNK